MFSRAQQQKTHWFLEIEIPKLWPENQKCKKDRYWKKRQKIRNLRKCSAHWFSKNPDFFAVYFTYRVSPNPDQPLCSTLSFTNCRLHYVLSTLQFFVNLSLSLLLSMNGITSRWILFFLPENNFPPIFFPLYSTCSSSLGKASSEKLQ